MGAGVNVGGVGGGGARGHARNESGLSAGVGRIALDSDDPFSSDPNSLGLGLGLDEGRTQTALHARKASPMPGPAPLPASAREHTKMRATHEVGCVASFPVSSTTYVLSPFNVICSG